MVVLMMLKVNLLLILAGYTTPFAIKLPNRLKNFICYFLPASLQEAKSFIGIECNEDIIPLTTGLPQDLAYMFLLLTSISLNRIRK